MPRLDWAERSSAELTLVGATTPEIPDNINAALLSRPRFIAPIRLPERQMFGDARCTHRWELLVDHVTRESTVDARVGTAQGRMPPARVCQQARAGKLLRDRPRGV